MEIVIGLLIGLALGAVLFAFGRREVVALRADSARLRSEVEDARASVQQLELGKITAETQLAERSSQLLQRSDELADEQKHARQLQDELGSTREDLREVESDRAARIDELNKKQQEIDAFFKSIASDVAKASNEEFRKQAAEDFKRQRELAEQELKERVEPVGKSLDELRKQITQLEKQREGAYEGVSELIKSTQQRVDSLSSETGDLREILRSSRHRGQWGERTLENILELAGLRQGTDFETQTSGDHGSSIADFVVRVPGGKRIIIDAKTPFDAYREALDAESVEHQEALLMKHAETVQNTARALHDRRYDQQFENSLDFVVMWIPTDSILEGATRAMPSLIDEAFAKHRVLLATPVTMIALVSGLAAALRQEEQTELLHKNALEIQAAGSQLYSGVRNHAKQYLQLGKDITKLAKTYDSGIATIQGNLIRGARNMRELGVGDDEPFNDPEPLHLETREYRARELQDLNDAAD